MAKSTKPTYKRHLEPSPNRLRRIEALNMRKLGFTYAEIKERLGYSSIKSARGSVSVALRAVEVEAVEDFRRVHLARLETMLTKVWPGILEGDPRSIEAGVRIVESERKLLGLDMPVKAEISGGLGLAMLTTPQIRFIVEGQVRELPSPEFIEGDSKEIAVGHRDFGSSDAK